MDNAFGNWLAGFIDGEGCFTVEVPGPALRKGKTVRRRPSLRFSILVRMDDADVIREIHARTGIGKLIFRPARYNAGNGARPQIVWRVQKRDECVELAALLDKYPLRAKKKRDLAVWRMALNDMVVNTRAYGRRTGSPKDDDEYILRMEGYRDALRIVREYDEHDEIAPAYLQLVPQHSA